MSGRDLTQTEETELETLIDNAGLCAVLQSLSSICDQKGAHILASYSDHTLAKAWATAGGVLGAASVRKDIMAIGKP